MTDFAKRYPKISLNCNHYSGPLPDNDHHYDLTFVLHEPDLPASNWIVKTLLSFPQSIFAGSDFDNSILLDPLALQNLPYILSEQQEQWLFRDGKRIQSVAVQGRASFSSPTMCLQAVIQNLGIAKLPDYSCQKECNLQRLQLSKPPVAVQLSVLYQSRDIAIKTRFFRLFSKSARATLLN